MKKLLSLMLLLPLIAIFGCSPNEEPIDPNVSNEANLKANRNSNSARHAPAIWSDCDTYGTLATKTSFKPTAGNFDEIYVGAMFKNGLGAISESHPGDQDYNGGRWHVNTLKAGVDMTKYWDACSVEDLDLSDFESTDVYFECPMLPNN